MMFSNCSEHIGVCAEAIDLEIFRIVSLFIQHSRVANIVSGKDKVGFSHDCARRLVRSLIDSEGKIMSTSNENIIDVLI